MRHAAAYWCCDGAPPRLAGQSHTATRNLNVSTAVTLTTFFPLAMLMIVKKKSTKTRQRPRPPRIRVPNSERALFTVDDVRFVGVLQRLSLTGGSAVLSKGPISHGTMGDIALSTIHGKVTAQVEFLQTGADGIPLAQAFRFLSMEDRSAERFAAAAAQMEKEGFSDAPSAKTSPLSAPASEALSLLLHSVRRLAATIVANR